MPPALEVLYQIKSLEELNLLKTESFLKSCAISDLSLHLEWNQPVNDLNQSLRQEPLSSQNLFQYSQTLCYQGQIYGSIVFYSHKKFSGKKKSFLEKLSHSLSITLFFIQENQKKNEIKNQWKDIFNSFPQAFCVTNESFQIIRCNQAFQQLFAKSKKEIFFQNLFQLFPVPVKIPKTFKKKPCSFIARGEDDTMYWKIVCQKLFLKRESSESFLFLITDISSEISLEAQISSQSKNQEIGLMKGSLAHELNNPITGIKLLISIIENEIPNSEQDIREHLKEMQKSISNCQKVIQNLLSASKRPRLKT